MTQTPDKIRQQADALMRLQRLLEDADALKRTGTIMISAHERIQGEEGFLPVLKVRREHERFDRIRTLLLEIAADEIEEAKKQAADLGVDITNLK